MNAPRSNPWNPPNRRGSRGLALAGLLVMAGRWVAGAAGAAGAAESGPLRAGASVVDISPTHAPVIVNAMFTERTATQTVDRLEARALVLDDGAERIVLVIVDTCMMPRSLIDEAKGMANRRTGIRPDRMLVAATHTHSAPAAMGCLGSRVDPRYAVWLPGRIAEAIVAANERLEPAELGWAVVDDWDHTFNRRWIRRPDRLLDDPFGGRTVRAHMHPGHESPDAVGPSGPVDPGLSVVAVRSRAGRPLAVLANYSQHYYGSPLLSSDYFGRFARHLEERIAGGPGAAAETQASAPALVAMMSQGTSGDLMWMDYAAPRRDIGYDAYAREMAARVFEAYQGIPFRARVPLRMAERRLALDYRVPDAGRLAWARQTAASLGDRLPSTLPEIYALEAIHLHERGRTELVLQALDLGGLGVAALPNEVFAITGLKLKAQSPLQPTFNIELANGAEGYIPPPEQHHLGGYTTWPARTAGLEVQAEPKIVAALLSLLEEVSGRERRPLVTENGPYAMGVLAARPLAYWRLDDLVMPAAADASGASRPARFENGIALYLPGVGSGEGVSPDPALIPSPFSRPPQINRAVHVAGGRLRAELPGLGPVYSVEFWFWNGLPESVRPVTGYLFSRGAPGDPQVGGDHLGLGGTHQPERAGRLFFYNGARRDQILAGRTPIGWRRWHHVVLVRDGNRVRVYLDGRTEPEIEGQAEATWSEGEAGETVFLGGRSDGFAGLEGKLDEVAIYDRVLKPEEISRRRADSGLGTATPSSVERPVPAPDSPPRSPAESLSRLRVTSGFRVELMAAEPLVIDPVAIDWDLAGRLWVVEMADYPLGMDGLGKPGGRVRVLEDTDGDGRYDRSTVFAEGLPFPNGILTWRDGVLVTAAPDVLYLRDSNGDGRADVREVLLTGFLEGNQQLRVNGLRWGLDNWVYCAAGGHHRGHGAGTRIRSTRAGTEVALGSRDFRFRPDTGEFDPQSGPAQFGRNRDDWGRWFGTQNSWPLWHYVLPDHYLRRNPYFAAPDPVHQVMVPMNPKVYPASRPEKRFHSFDQAGHFTSACGGMIYQDDLLFPSEPGMQAFVCEPFHNLVHREQIEDEGVTFAARRVPAEADSEFFASDDRWCRPVMTRTGPDGGLWVVDMYRYMIEHPEWLPEEGRAELLPHYREGDDRGRLYRILPVGVAPRPWPRLDRLSSVECVGLLESPNGWLRDKAQQALIWRQDRAALAPLETLARTSSRAVTRLHALCTLDGLGVGALAPGLVEAALGDPHPGVRANALRLAETRATPEVRTAALALERDPDPKVRMQLAFSLGEWSGPDAGQSLGRLLVGAGKDDFLQAAALSSAVPHFSALVEAAREAGPDALDRLLEPLAQLCLAKDDATVLRRLMEPILTAPEGRFESRQFAAFERFVDILDRHRRRSGDDPRARGGNAEASWLGLTRPDQPILEAAARRAHDPQVPPVDQLVAASLAGRDPARRPMAREALVGWLDSKSDPEIQRMAIGALAKWGDADTPDPILRGWPGYGPRTRVTVVDTLSGRTDWALALLGGVRDGRVQAHAFDASRRSRLMRHGSPAVRELASRVFGEGTGTSRAGVIQSYRAAASLSGDPGRGAGIYDRLCLVCHRRDGRGHEVGPDLRSVAQHPPEKLLVSILDPSAEVQPGFQAYRCALSDGEELYGVIAAETGNSLVLKLPDGSSRTLLRTDIVELAGTDLSLMPEGLEVGLEPQGLADLIAYLRAP